MRRRAVLAIVSFLTLPPATVWLFLHHKPAAGLLALGLLVVHATTEVVAFELADRRRAVAHLRDERAAAEPILGDYCAQVEDRYYTDVELRNGRVAM